MEAEWRKSKSVFGDEWVMWLDLNREACEREWRNQPRKAGAGPTSADLESKTKPYGPLFQASDVSSSGLPQSACLLAV